MGLSDWEKSFWVSVDGGTEHEDAISSLDGVWTWRWQRVDIGPLFLLDGPHSVCFRVRERNARLDSFVITNQSPHIPGGVDFCGGVLFPLILR